MKKKLLLVVIFLILIGVLAFIFLRRPVEEKIAEPTPPKKATVVSLDELDETDRPQIILTARADGKELKLEMENLAGFETVEYELIYLTNGVQRGVIGEVDLTAGSKTVSRDLLLGTCSRNVCRYDPNVTGGTLNVVFRGEKSYRYSRDFILKTASGRTTVIMAE